MSLLSFHKFLAFPGATGYSYKCQDEREGGYFLQAELDRARSWMLSRKDTKAQMEMIPHTFL